MYSFPYVELFFRYVDAIDRANLLGFLALARVGALTFLARAFRHFRVFATEQVREIVVRHDPAVRIDRDAAAAPDALPAFVDDFDGHTGCRLLGIKKLTNSDVFPAHPEGFRQIPGNAPKKQTLVRVHDPRKPRARVRPQRTALPHRRRVGRAREFRGS